MLSRLPDPSFALRSEILNEADRLALRSLRKALRLFSVQDHEAVIQGEASEGLKDRQYYIFRLEEHWTVVYMERGNYHRHACYFDRAQDACDYLFWKLTARAPVAEADMAA
ncbi:MAG: hypothetical protein K2P80_07970 [Beijerinckiaceae bacterium]|nr:hypothetical protein [Beijerinckiaceae bacterium]